MPHTVLIVDDDPVLLREAERALAEHQFTVIGFRSGSDAVDALQSSNSFPDIIVLDRMMPGWDGITTFKKIKQTAYDGPIIFLTALDELEERIEGYEVGADDYIVKPFSYHELAVRIRARLRSTGGETTKILVGPFFLDLIKSHCEINGQKVLMRPKEFKLLQFLLENVSEVVSREMVLRDVMGYNFDPGNNIVDVHISRLRKHLKEAGIDDWSIAAIRGQGYTLQSTASD